MNGEILENDTANHLLESLEKIKSTTGNLTYNSPQDKDAVVDLIRDTKGITEPTVKVQYENGIKATLTDKSFAEVIPISIEDTDNFYRNLDNIVGNVINKDEFSKVSIENKRIYDKFYSLLESTYNKFLK